MSNKTLAKKSKVKLKCANRQTMNSYSCHSLIQNRIIQPKSHNSQKLFREKLLNASSLFHSDIKGHFGCVNAIEFSNNGGNMIASGGDDRRVLLWNTQKAMWRKGSPSCMKSEHRSNIFCIAFDKDNEKIFSGGNDEQVFVHDAATGNPVDNFMHEDAVYGLSTDPNNPHVFASACDDGRILIYDIREPADSEPFCLANYVSSMHSVMYNPLDPRLVATANVREGIGLWDVRKPKSCIMRYGGEFEQQSCMSVRINNQGTQILALRRRLPPVIYNIDSKSPVVEFDHTGYFNSCTMKSCCFAGDRDQYILSGSDDFNVYMWAIPPDLSTRQYINKAHLVLKGHRSIVNQVRFNRDNGLIISSGVEKTIKAWCAFPLNVPDEIEDNDELLNSNGERPVFTHEEYINLMLRSGHVMSHDYTQQSTEEDPRMMAFFDSLVQREMESWSSSEEFSSNEEELYDRILRVSRDPQEPVSPLIAEELDSNDSADDFSPFTLAFASIMAARTEEQNGQSLLLNVDESTDNENDTTTTSNDTPSSSNRPSISDIIAKNKQETLLKAKESRKKQNRSNSKPTQKRQIVSSETDSDDEVPISEKIPKISNEMGESSTSGNNDSNKKLDCNSKRNKVKFHLKKLRELRTQLINGDSDSDTNHLDPTASVTSEQPSASCKDDSATGNEFGPFLQEISDSVISKFGNSCKKSCENRVNNNVNDNSETIVHNGQVDGVSKNLKEKLNASIDFTIPVACSTNTRNPVDNTSNICDNINQTENKNKSHGEKTPTAPPDTLDNVNSSTHVHNNSLNDDGMMTFDSSANGPSSSSSQQSDIHTNDVPGDSEPTWQEFKRYKRTLERAQRYYRKHSGSQPSSDDE